MNHIAEELILEGRAGSQPDSGARRMRRPQGEEVCQTGTLWSPKGPPTG
jgi:hypothetical protein